MALMPTYPNGRVPANKLVVFNKGVDKYGRYYEWRLPPSTYRKHLALVARALKRTGRTLSPSEGWSCDRPYAEQVFARSIHGIFAAKPGTSSHGGCWAGPPTGWRIVDTAAIDYHNWAWVYENHGGRDAFFADVRAVGLVAGGISRPAFPDEPWHVIDLDPWAPVPADDDSKPFPDPEPDPEPDEPEEEDDNMKVFGYIKKGATRTTYVTFDFAGGLWNEFETDSVDYARDVSMKWSNGHGAPLLSLGHRDSLRADFVKRWPGI